MTSHLLILIVFVGRSKDNLVFSITRSSRRPAIHCSGGEREGVGGGGGGGGSHGRQSLLETCPAVTAAGEHWSRCCPAVK